MSLLTYFKRYYHDIPVYSLTATTGAWGTAEKDYPATATRTVKGYIQPVGGSELLKNQSLDNVQTHRMYVENTVVFSDTDRIIYNGDTFHLTYNQKNGIANIGDHKEVALTVQR